MRLEMITHCDMLRDQARLFVDRRGLTQRDRSRRRFFIYAWFGFWLAEHTHGSVRRPQTSEAGMTFSKFGMTGAALVCAGLFASSSAVAGNTYHVEVTVSGSTTGYARGTLTTARDSSDNNQWILCSVTATSGSESVQCTAENSAGTFKSCVNTSSRLVDDALGITSYGYLRFEWDNGTCTEISVTNGSRFLP